MKSQRQRRVFTIIMSVLATTFGGFAATIRLSAQADVLGDAVKIGCVLALGTAIASFMFWTITHYKRSQIWRGGLAGFLTAISIVPLPFFVYAFRAEFISNFKQENLGFFESLFLAVLPALKSGLFTFVDISKASLIAVLASIMTGLMVAYFIKERE